MRKLFATIILLAMLGGSAHALSVDFRMGSSGGTTYTSYVVEGKSFTLYGSEYKTLETSEGRYTFYANALYHKGNKDARKHQSYLELDMPESGFVQKTISALSPYECELGNTSHRLIVEKVKLADVHLKDHDDLSFSYIYPEKGETAEIYGSKGKDSFADILIGCVVIVIEKEEKYWNVETGEFKGWMRAEELEPFTPPEAVKNMYLQPGADIVTADRKDAKIYWHSINGQDLPVIGERGEYYEVIANNRRLFVRLDQMTETIE